MMNNTDIKNEFIKAKNKVKLTPGEMLKTLRELQEMAQLEMSDHTGVSQSNISAIENGNAQNRQR